MLQKIFFLLCQGALCVGLNFQDFDHIGKWSCDRLTGSLYDDMGQGVSIFFCGVGIELWYQTDGDISRHF